MKKVYLNTTWFVDGDGYRGMVEVCRPSVEPETIHCEKIRSDIPEALADAEALKLNMQAVAPELLAACKKAEQLMEGMMVPMGIKKEGTRPNNILKLIVQAIAKAEKT